MLYEKIIVNIAFLIVSAYTYGLILKLLKKDGLKKEAITGCLFGLISILSMIYSFKINAGLIFDGRSIILGLSGIIGGIFSAVISVIIALFYRILLGGDGTITGVLVILVSGLIGGLSHAYLKKVRKRIKLSQVYALGLLIHLITILLFFTIPGNNSASIIKNLLIPFLVFFPIATVLIYILFVDQRIRMENKVRLIESENKFRTAFEQSASGMCITSLEGQLVKVNAPLCKILGYQKKELEGSHFNSITHKNDIDIGKEFINKMLNNKADSGSFEKRYIHKSSHVIWININSALIRDANNEPLHFITQIEDITERKLFEKKIFDSKKETERYLDMTQSIILVLNAKGEIQIINQKGLDILEYEREELIGENWFKTCIPKEELDKVLHVFDKIIRGKAQPQEHIENEIITKSGKRKKIAWYNTFLKNEKEKITSTLSSGQDITERKNAEEKLRLSEERFSTAFNVGPTGMTITRISDGKFINVNNYFLELFEFSRDEVIEHTSTELNMWTTEERQKIINAQVQLGGLKSTELSALTKSGKKIDILFSSKPIELQNEAYLITTLIDLTSKKKTETELKESETKYYTLFDYAPYGILIANTESYYLNANKSMCKMLGLTLDELVGKHATDIVMPIEYKYINPALKEIQSDKNYQKEWIFKRKDGSTFIGDVMVTPMPDGNLMAIVIDITERKQINEVIQRQEQIMNQIHGAIIATDLKGIIVDWNNGAIRMFEYTKDEALGKPITFIYPEDQLSILTEKIQPQVRKSGWYETEVRLKSKSGKEFPVHISLAALKNPTGFGFFAAMPIYQEIKEKTDISLCASMGLINEKQIKRLIDEVGIEHYHCNLETAPSYFPEVCSSHSMDEKIETIKAAQKQGLKICSGGIIGMGETMEHRVELACSLRDLGVQSIPINILTPVEGTKLENSNPLSEEEVLTTIAVFRFINPKANLRFAGGRLLIKHYQEKALRAGISASLTGDYLTTSGSDVECDIRDFRKAGFTISKDI